MTRIISSDEVNRVIDVIKELANDGDTQLTIMALALVGCCKALSVSKEMLIEHISTLYDDEGIIKFDA